jgi:hypothetical protein
MRRLGDFNFFLFKAQYVDILRGPETGQWGKRDRCWLDGLWRDMVEELEWLPEPELGARLAHAAYRLIHLGGTYEAVLQEYGDLVTHHAGFEADRFTTAARIRLRACAAGPACAPRSTPRSRSPKPRPAAAQR